ncbi:hypothetical protein D3C72_1762390 [compost metagenome]
MSSASCNTRCIRWLGESASPPLIFACLPDLTIVLVPRSDRVERPDMARQLTAALYALTTKTLTF